MQGQAQQSGSKSSILLRQATLVMLASILFAVCLPLYPITKGSVALPLLDNFTAHCLSQDTIKAE